MTTPKRLSGLSLSHKLVLTFVGFILVFAVANVVAASRVVDGRVRAELETSELSFAKSLATRLFPQIRDADRVHLTETLLDEMSMREDKLEYLVLYDREGKLLAHTYLVPLPGEARALRNDFAGADKEGRTSRVTGAQIDAFDVAVPVLEGIQQVGSVHVGIRAAYLDRVKSDLIRLLEIVAGVTSVLATLLALGLARVGLRPVHRLVAGIRSLERGERTRVVVSGHDELAMLATAFNEMVDRIGEREDALKAAFEKVRLVLDNTGDGLLTARVDGTCDETVSRAMCSWFGEYDGQPVWDYLFAGDDAQRALMQVGLAACADGFMPKEVLLAQLPSKITRGEREYRVSYRQIGDGEEITSLLVVVNDVTEELARAKAEAETRERQAIVVAFAQDREGAARAFGECRALVAALRVERELVVQKRLIHTLKGCGAMLGLASVAATCHAVEDELADEPTSFGREHLERLAAAWARVDQEIARSFPDLGNDRIEIDAAEYAGLMAKVAQSGARKLLPAIEAMRNTPTMSIFRSMRRATEHLAARLGKAVEIEVASHGVRVDMGVMQEFWASLVHVVRNALDHGIEMPAERAAAGKPAAGHLCLSSDLEGDVLRITVADDGRGIDWEQIRERARALDVPCERHDELVAALFADGLSTRDQASELSGRGVGMAAVLAAVKPLGGEIAVDTVLGRGTTVSFAIPIRLGGAEAVRRAGRVVSLPPRAA